MGSRRPLTLGQQAIRLSASAAVCGLSLSYIVGAQLSSTFGQFNTNVRSEVTMPVLEPVSLLLNFASNADWSKQFSIPEVVAVKPTAVVIPAPERKKISSRAVAKKRIAKTVTGPTLMARVAIKKIVRDQIRLKTSAVKKSQVQANVDTTTKMGSAGTDQKWISNTSRIIPVQLDAETMVSQKVIGPEFPELYELLLGDRFAYENILPKIQTLDTQPQVPPTNEDKYAVDRPTNINSILLKAKQETVRVASAEKESPAPESKPAPTVTIPKVVQALEKNELKDASETSFTVLDFDHADKMAVTKLQSKTGTHNEVLAQAARRTTVYEAPKKTIDVQKITEGRISGKILGSLADYPGHFELGLYAHIGEDGYPVGAPTLWDSLEEGKNTFNFSTGDHVSIQNAYLFAHYFGPQGETKWIAYSANPISLLGSGQYSSLDIQLPIKDSTHVGLMSATSRNEELSNQEVLLRGRVVKMFEEQVGGIRGATIKVRGTKTQTSSDGDGNYELRLPSSHSNYLIEVSQPGYLPSIFSISGRTAGAQLKKFELVNKQLLEQLAAQLSIRQTSFESVFITKIQNSNGAGLPGYTTQLSLHADGPYYFTKEGRPSAERDSKGTTSDGRVIFFNVAAGVGSLEAYANGSDPLAPIQISAVEGGEMIFQELELSTGKIAGRIFDATKKDRLGRVAPVGGARVRIEGSSEWANTDPYGNFSLPQTKFFKDQPLQIEVNHEGYYAHSFRVPAPAADAVGGKSLYMFPMSYINHLASKSDVALDPYGAVIFGSTGPGFKVRIDALSDHSTRNQAKDFYFDKHQDLRGSHAYTDEKFGTYMIFNVPRGRTLLNGYDGLGKLKYSNTVNANPSTVSVILPE